MFEKRKSFDLCLFASHKARQISLGYILLNDNFRWSKFWLRYLVVCI